MRSTEPYLDDYFWEVAPTLQERIKSAGMSIVGKRLIETNKHQVLVAQKPA